VFFDVFDLKRGSGSGPTGEVPRCSLLERNCHTRKFVAFSAPVQAQLDVIGLRFAEQRHHLRGERHRVLPGRLHPIAANRPNRLAVFLGDLAPVARCFSHLPARFAPITSSVRAAVRITNCSARAHRYRRPRRAAGRSSGPQHRASRHGARHRRRSS